MDGRRFHSQQVDWFVTVRGGCREGKTSQHRGDAAKTKSPTDPRADTHSLCHCRSPPNETACVPARELFRTCWCQSCEFLLTSRIAFFWNHKFIAIVASPRSLRKTDPFEQVSPGSTPRCRDRHDADTGYCCPQRRSRTARDHKRHSCWGDLGNGTEHRYTVLQLTHHWLINRHFSHWIGYSKAKPYTNQISPAKLSIPLMFTVTMTV